MTQQARLPACSPHYPFFMHSAKQGSCEYQGDQIKKFENAELAQKSCQIWAQKAKSRKTVQAAQNKKLLLSLFTKIKVLIKKLHCILYTAAGCMFVDNISFKSEQHDLRYKQIFAKVTNLQQHVRTNFENSFQELRFHSISWFHLYSIE